MMRCPEYNGQISSTGSDGPHTTGYAADIACSQIEFLEIFQYAANNHVMRIGIQQAGRDHTRYIHLDICDKRFPGMFNPAVWQY